MRSTAKKLRLSLTILLESSLSRNLLAGIDQNQTSRGYLVRRLPKRALPTDSPGWQPGAGKPAIERLARHFRAQNRPHRDQLLDVDSGGKTLALAQDRQILEHHFATAAMALVSVSVVGKALRLRVTRL